VRTEPRAGDAAHFRVAAMYHPVAHVPDLDEAESFYGWVFGRASVRLSSFMTTAPAPGHSIDHSVFTPVSDVFLDSLAPARYRTHGLQRFPDVIRPHLATTGWYVDGAAALADALRDAGYQLVDARDEPLDTGAPSPYFFGRPDEMGLPYQFLETFPFPHDRRTQASWSVPPVADDDPLGIVRASHHTVLTANPDRALRLLVDVLGGVHLGETVDGLRAAAGPLIRLGGSVLHLAKPDPGGLAARDHRRDGPQDTYHAITWCVEDLDRVAAHLEAERVAIAARSADTIITDPTTALGVPWGFTTEPIEGATR
jgi:extradiol dioxygenase family protein